MTAQEELNKLTKDAFEKSVSGDLDQVSNRLGYLEETVLNMLVEMRVLENQVSKLKQEDRTDAISVG